MPVVFLPPRDGRTLTDPVPIIGRGPLPPLSPPSTDEGVNGHIDNAIYYDEVEVEEEGGGGGDGGRSGCCSYADDDDM